MSNFSFFGRGGQSYANNPEVPDGSLVAVVNAGAGSSLVVDGAGPALSFKSISQGANITLTEVNNDIAISAANVSVTSAGPGLTLIVDGTGPALSLKGVNQGAGITLTEVNNDIVISDRFATTPFAQVVNTTFASAVVGAATIVPIGATQWNKGPLTITADAINFATAGIWEFRIEVSTTAADAGVTGLVILPIFNGISNQRYRLPMVAGQAIAETWDFCTTHGAIGTDFQVSIEAFGANQTTGLIVRWSARYLGPA